MFVYISPHRLDLAYIYHIMLCFHLPPRQHLHVVLLENLWTFFSYIRKYMRSLWRYATVIYTIAAKMSTLTYTSIRPGCRELREFYVLISHTRLFLIFTKIGAYLIFCITYTWYSSIKILSYILQISMAYDLSDFHSSWLFIFYCCMSRFSFDWNGGNSNIYTRVNEETI